MTKPAQSSPFYARIAFKTSLLVALMLGVGLIFRSALLEGSVNVFEAIFGRDKYPLEDYADFFPDGVYPRSDPEAEPEGGWGPTYDLLHTFVDLDLLGHVLPEVAERSPEQGWTVSAEVLQNVENELAAGGQGFVWLDKDRHVIASSSNLGFESGEMLPPGFAYPPLDDSSDPEHPAVWSMSFPVDMGAERAGWVEVVQVHSPGDYSLLDAEEAEYYATLDRQAERTETFQKLGLALVGALVVLLLATAISLFVTRRLSRLASKASAIVPGGGLPGPFDASGRDEISTLASALNTMRDRASELLDRFHQREVDRREFIAQVSHDLRTPLAALVACLDGASLQLERADLAPEELRETLRQRIGLAHTDADRVSALADDLLEVARMDVDDPLDLGQAPPGEVVRHAIAVIQPLADQRGLNLEIDLPRGLPTLHADGRRLLRAIENLLRNAVEHARSSIVVVVRSDTENLTFEVRDDGPGLPIDESGAVDWTQTRKVRSRADSAGLGLALTKRVAETHGGQLTARNLEGGGAAVGIELPIRTNPDEEGTDSFPI